MSASITTSTTDGKRIGTTAIGAAGGGVAGLGVGKAIAAILIHVFPSLQGIEWAIEILVEFVLTGIGGLLGGKYSPTNMVKTVTEFIQPELTSQVTPEVRPENMTVETDTVVVEKKTDESVDSNTTSIQIIE